MASIGTDKDYATLALWEADISADPGTDQTATVETDEDVGPVEIDVSNSSNVTFTIEADASHRWNQDADDTPVSAIVGTHARATTSGDVIQMGTTGSLVVQYMEISDTSTNNVCVRTSSADTMSITVQYCVLHIGDKAIHDETAPGAGSELNVYNCFIYNFDTTGIKFDRSNTTGRAYHNTVVNIASAAGIADTGATTYFYGNAVFNCGGDCIVNGDNKGDNHEDDGSGDTDVGDWMDFVMNANPGEEDLRPTASREWAEDLVYGFGSEGGVGDPLLDSGNFDAVAAKSGMRGSYCERINVGTTSADYYNHGAALGTDTYTSFYLHLDDPGFVMADGDNFAFMKLSPNASSSVAAYIFLERSGANYQIRPYTSVHNMTAVTINRGTTYHIRIRLNLAASGNFEWWIDDVSQESDAGDYSALSFGRWYVYSGVALDAGTSGYVYLDHRQVTTSAHIEPDDSTSPYGDTARTTYADCTDRNATIGYTDIQGVTRPTGNTWLPGAWDVAAAGGGKTFVQAFIIY